ncbi:hypothetical protein ABMA27_008186 [Loxostege sticticalis]|uniref:Gustatory receptor n=1 Tax=Loxostege sticticalis TaxID=481309 RepID=A0ABR3HER0_LOXSC
MIGTNSDSYNLDVSSIISCLTIVLFRICINFFFCYFNPDNCVTIPFIRILFFIPLFSVDIVLVVYFYTFYFVYCRMKNFCNIVKDSTNIINCHFLYKTIAELTEKVKNGFDGVFIVSLLFNAPECMASVFFTLKQIISDGKLMNQIMFQTSSAFGGYLTTTQSLIVIFSPAFSAGLLAAEVQKIKLILHDKLFLERELKHTKDIERFISYIEARPLRFTICKIIPLDWNLPFIVLNLCTTYLIVVIQFTHLY